MEKKKKETLLYEGKVLRLTLDEVQTDNGTTSFREVVHHRSGVVILALIDEQHFLIERQQRYVYQEDIYELPAGKLEKEDKSTLEAAKRELQEETGYLAKQWTSLGEIYPSCGYTNEVLHLFLAEDLTFLAPHLDEDEVLQVERCSFETFEKWVIENKVKDAKTICALYRYQLQKKSC